MTSLQAPGSPPSPPSLCIRGLPRGAGPEAAQSAVSEVLREATDDLAWLRPGDRVLLKVSLNSPDPYPATTAPVAVRAVAEALAARGAEVIVGDMSGFEYVVLDAKGSHRLASRECWERSGMGAGVTAPFQGFEERGFAEGFVHVTDPRAASWPKGFHVTRWIDEVDHIIALPRLSTHTQAGVTLAYKLAVGYLRHDSRLEFHRDGPFYGTMKTFARGTSLPTRFPNGHRFFEKIVEANLPARPKQRLVLAVGTRAQVTFGPDRRVPVFGLRSQEIVPDTGLVFASPSAVAAEALGVAFLTRLYGEAPFGSRLLQKVLMLVNRQAHELGRGSVWDQPFLRHALALGLDGPDFAPTWTDVPDALREDLTARLARPTP